MLNTNCKSKDFPEENTENVKKKILRSLNRRSCLKYMCDLRRETYDELAVANTTCRLVNTNRRFILDKSSPKKTDVSFKQCAIMKSGNILDTPIDLEKTILMDAHEKLERVDQMLYQRANLKETIDNRFISVIHSRIRIYFNVWLRVTVDYRSAQFLRHHHLLVSVFHVWKCQFNSRMLLKLKNQQSVNHFHIKLKTRSILLWVLYCKRKQHKYTLMKTANTFYRRHILQYYITCWHKNYFLTGESISQKHLLSAARAYNRRKILNKALCTWIVRKQIWQVKRNHREIASHFFQDKVNTSIVRSIFKQWFQQILDIDLSNKCNRYRILKRFFNLWSYQYTTSIRYHKIYYSACNFHRISTCRRFLSLWRSYILYKKEIKRKLTLTITFYKVNRIRKCFSAWKMYYTEVIDHRRIAEYMFMKRYTLLIQQCLLNWKYYITVKQALYMKSLHFKESLKNKLRQQYLHQWLDNLHYKKSIECLINHFQEVKTIQFMKKIFVAWFKWVRTRHTHQLHTQMIFNHAVQLLHNLRIRLYFIHWKSTHRYYSNCQLAQNLYSKHKLIQCFSAWLTYILIKKKRMKLKYIADNYRNQSIQNYVLKYWHSKFIEAKHMQTLNYIAIVRWSLYLQARVWQGWRLWIIKRNEKKSKRVIAMQRFIQHRTVDALRLWISMGLYRRHERHLEYCSKFWNNNSRVFNLILNITTHWYWWTLSRMDYKRLNENKSILCCQEEISSLTHNYNRLDKCLQFINNIHITHNGDIMFGLRNHHQLTPPRYPDFILSELQSLQFTDQFLPISTDIGESDKQMHYETLNPDEIRCSTPICLSGLRVQDINLYMNSLEEKISNYKMMKSMYTIMRKRFHLEDRHRNEVNNNDEKVISLRKRIKEEKAECISLIKELRLLFKHQHDQQPYQYVT